MRPWLPRFLNVPKAAYINDNVILILFNLMLVIKALESVRLLDRIAVAILDRIRTERYLILFLCLLTFFFSMFVTNDVALLTLVPLTLTISRRVKINVFETVVLQTMSANVGSSLTPMGNPQNLYIFYYYHLSAADFMRTVLPLALAGLVLIVMNMIKFSKIKINLELEKEKLTDIKKMALYFLLFAVSIAGVFRLIPNWVSFMAIVIVILFTDRKLIFKVDYALLLTFVCFFIFIGNLQQFTVVKSFMEAHLNTEYAVYFLSILTSQITSNVPASVLLSAFTHEYKALLLGVDIGGLGTLVASLASLISYKLLKNDRETKGYLKIFTAYNFLYLIILTAAGYLFLGNLL